MRDNTGQERRAMTTTVDQMPEPDDGGKHEQEDHRRQRHGKVHRAHGERVGEAPAEGRDRADEEADGR